MIAQSGEQLVPAEKIVLPGVGAFDRGMEQLEKRGFLDVLERKVNEEKVPVLGVCLGMQLMTRGSEEGKRSGLGWIAADTKAFRPGGEKLRIPHMRWNIVDPAKASALLDAQEQELRFYFVHSYYVSCDNPGDVLATTRYGHDFVSAFERGNIVGTQFHPEKSHRFGMAFFRRFVERF